MIASINSGKRSLPIFRASIQDILKISSGDAFLFDVAPAVQIVVQDGVTISAVKLVSLPVLSETAITPSFAMIGDYDCYTIAESTVPNGRYYYELSIDSVVYRTNVFTVKNCTRFKLSYLNSCEGFMIGTNNHVNHFDFEDLHIKPISFTGFEDTEENGDGTETVFYSRKTTVYEISFKGDRYLWDRLNYLEYFDTIALIDSEGDSYSIDPTSIELSNETLNDKVETITMQFSILDSDIDTENCSCDAFTGGAADTDDPCASYSISIDSSSYPILSYTAANDPETATEVRWFKDGVFISNASSINAGSDSATYTVKVKSEGCVEKVAHYAYTNPCEQFRIVESVAGPTINATFENIPSGETVAISVKNQNGTEVATSLPYTATVSGGYTITGTTASCSKSKTVRVLLSNPNTCAHSVAILYNNEILSAAVIGGDGSETYQWIKVDANSTETVVGSQLILTPGSTGTYRVEVTLNGCTAVSNSVFFILQETAEPQLYYEYFSFERGNVDPSKSYLQVTTGALPDPSEYTVDQINQLINAYSNTGVLTYKENPDDSIYFGIDHAANRITWNTLDGTVPQFTTLQLRFKTRF